MQDSQNIQFKYRKWPVFVPAYLVFALVYFFVFLNELAYRNIAETAVMTLFIATPLLIIFFNLKIVKTYEYKRLAFEILMGWIFSTFTVFAIMMTYLDGEEWLGAIFLLFLLFVYNIIAFPVAYILSRIARKSIIKNNA